MCLVLSCAGGDDGLGDPVADKMDPQVDPCSLLSPTEISEITGWEVSGGTDHSDSSRNGTRSVCSFSEQRHAGVVQVQWSLDGVEEFDRARAEMETTGMDGGDVEVAGAAAAYDAPDHGVVGMLIDDGFAQVATIGPAVSDGQHLELAAVVAGNL